MRPAGGWHHGAVRVVIAPGSFGRGLSAVEAAAAIAAGWARRAPDDALVLAPVSDAGEGYVDVLHTSLGGEPVADGVLVVGTTAYVEAARVVGSALAAHSEPERVSSLGVGRLVADVLRAGAERVVVGVGRTGVASNDGGAGLLAGLGAISRPPDALLAGSTGLDALVDVDLGPVHALVGRARLVLATDDDAPLLGLLGTTNTAGGRRGLVAERISVVDGRLEHLAGLLGRRLALPPGAGAGGGIGFALALVGSATAPGLGTVMDEISLAARASGADLVVAGEEAFDLSAGSGLVATGVASVAAAVARPCIVLANRVAVGAREMRALGIESAYAVRDLAGDDPAAAGPAERLAALAERVARTWSRPAGRRQP